MTINQIDPTDEQQSIIQAVAQPKGSIMVSAYAGCAKSSTLELAAPGIKVPALAVAFNRKITKELEKRLPGNFTVKSFNGLGHGAWMRAIGRPIQLEERKLGKLVTQYVKDEKLALTPDQWDMLRKITSRAQVHGLVPNGQGPEGLVPDNDQSWADVADALWLPPDEASELVPMAREILVQDIALARQGIISYDDQVYCPTLLGGAWPKYPVIFGDEAQDFSPLNQRMIQLALRPGGRLVLVGDPKQAIYAFRGADSNSMGNCKLLAPEWTDLNLTLTFRCPKVIVERQQGHAPGFRAHKSNLTGRVDKFLNGDEMGQGGWNWKNIQQAMDPNTRSIFILCRNNAPLLACAFKLIRQGIGVTMMGRDIGKGLIQLSSKISPDNNTTIVEFVGLVNDWRERELDLARANKREEREASIIDRAECLMATVSSGDPRCTGDVRGLLTKLFSSENSLIQLGTIHRAKGLEADLVVHLDPWRIPSRYAKELAKEGDMRQMIQERNLGYVGDTRTKNIMIEADLEGFI